MVLLILSAFSGTGKSTVAQALLARSPNLRLSVSHTTRAPRPGEVGGEAYHFIDEAEFCRRIEAGDFAEWAEYAGNLYGTARQTIEAADKAGLDLLFDVEVQGAEHLKKSYPEALSVFLLPPSWAVLEARLRGRGTETEESIRRRMDTARRELLIADRFDRFVVNDALDVAVDALESVYLNAQASAEGRACLKQLKAEVKQLTPRRI
ncbi:guanylate kinase [Myxococcota bacterium]|nr:guanylate kinase [Myxococcota bacterium]MBU1432721.1 guanylate kinase [Myxococcota bacterium]MBU1899410.1 guanylate kinase [Myxococcota bacterium]